MSALHQLQQHFQAYVLDGDATITAQVSPGRLNDSERRLDIYFDGYRARLHDVLANDYETLQGVLGSDAFRALARAYIQAQPSPWRNVRWYGGEMAGFLADRAPWKDTPFLAELARFEWTLTLAFDAPDQAHVSFATLSALPPEAWASVRFELCASAHVLPLHSNACGTRMAHDAGDALPQIAWAAEAVDWLIWRQDLGVHFRSLPPMEALALRAVTAGASFPELCGELIDHLPEDEVAGQAAAFLRGWVDAQIIAGVHAEGMAEGEGGEDLASA